MNKRILFFHSHIWRHYFRDLLTHLTREHGCAATVASPFPDSHHWRHLMADGGRHHVLPDLRRPQPFEAEPEGLAKLQNLVHRCEQAAGKSASRVLLAAERDMGRAFSRDFFIWFNTPLWRWCRKNPDRPRLALLRTFDFVRRIFDDTHPDMILTRSLSDRFALAAWFLAQERGIPLLTCRFSKLASKKAFWSDQYSMYNGEADIRFQELERSGTAAEPLFVESIKRFRDAPRIVDYIDQNWKNDQHVSIGQHIRQLGQVFREELAYYRKGCKGAKPQSAVAKLVERCHISINSRLHARRFRAYAHHELASFRYVYVALHKEPELMLNFESPLWHDQRHLVKFIASMLPTGIRLLVKEHRFNWGRRHSRYLDFLAGLPGVELVHPFDDQFKYLKHASLVITDNGSTGWEGLLLQKPVITLEETLYDAPGLTRTVFDPRRLDTAMLRALSEPLPFDSTEYDRRLALRLQAEDETTMFIEDMHRDMSLSVQAIERLIQKCSH